MDETNPPQITAALVQRLISEQFPQWADFAVVPVVPGGVDNRTFRLGEALAVRLPSAEGYAAQVAKEQRWLPWLAPQLTLKIPEPVAQVQPGQGYPWSGSVNKWIQGKPLVDVQLNAAQQEQLALDLASFLKELHSIDATKGPKAGLHNYYRGGSLAVYDAQTRSSAEALSDLFDLQAVLAIWEQAFASQWQGPAVWVHGDVAIGNLLLQEDTLHAVIDFGCMGVGDPACDLVMAWTFFEGTSRSLFMSALDLDVQTWQRARGWALWKALFELAQLADKASLEALKRKQVMGVLLKE